MLSVGEDCYSVMYYFYSHVIIAAKKFLKCHKSLAPVGQKMSTTRTMENSFIL